MPPDLRKEHIPPLYAHLLKHFGATKGSKSSLEMKLLGWTLQRLGVMDEEVFLQNYSQAVATRIYLNFEPGSGEPLAELKTIGHELAHVLQWKQYGAWFAGQYVLSPMRLAGFEAQAGYVSQELHYWATGTIPDPQLQAARLKAYGAGVREMNFAEAMLREHGKLVLRGGMTTAPAKEAIRFLTRQGLRGFTTM